MGQAAADAFVVLLAEPILGLTHLFVPTTGCGLAVSSFGLCGQFYFQKQDLRWLIDNTMFCRRVSAARMVG
jgi:hypothetical protein